MNKKAAVSLSINTLVIIIISLVILGGGVTLLYKFVGQADEVKGELDRQTDEQLERLLQDQGKQVALPLSTATIPAGKSHVFGLGILNTDPEQDFKIDIHATKVAGVEGSDITTPEILNEADTWLLYFEDQVITIPEYGVNKQGILVDVSKTATKGTYVFNVKVYKDTIDPDNQYGITQKFKVVVK